MPYARLISQSDLDHRHAALPDSVERLSQFLKPDAGSAFDGRNGSHVACCFGNATVPIQDAPSAHATTKKTAFNLPGKRTDSGGDIATLCLELSPATVNRRSSLNGWQLGYVVKSN